MEKKKKIEKKTVDRSKIFKPEEAVKLLKEVAWAKFDEGIDLSIKLATTPKKGTAPVRGVVSLPHGTGKKIKVAVIGSGVKVGEAEAAGADAFGGEELIEKIEKGFLDFDILISTPDMMGKVGKLGKVLGKRGLMPNPKSQTVTMDIKGTVEAFKKGKAEFKMDDTGVVHILIGKKSFSDQAILENLKMAVSAVQAAKPSSVKGAFIKSVFISSTMGPGIRVEAICQEE